MGGVCDASGVLFFFFKQKTPNDMRISDWSSDVCSSDLIRAEARQIAYAIANSPLVKTAMFAGDANWGRIVMAIGKAGVAGLDPAGVGIMLDDVVLLEHGQPHPDYEEAHGAAVVARPGFTIAVTLGRGTAQARLWTCDFSYDYVKINAEYRT